MIPGAGKGDRPEHRVDDLLPVGDELGLVSPAARHPRAAVAQVGGQQLFQHAAAELQHPGADHRLGRLHARVTAAQRPGRFRRQPAYLGGLLLRDRRPEPPFSPSGIEGASVPAAGLASQIFSFTSVICSLIAVNSACRRNLPPHPGHLPGRQLPADGAASPGAPGPQEPRPVTG